MDRRLIIVPSTDGYSILLHSLYIYIFLCISGFYLVIWKECKNCKKQTVLTERKTPQGPKSQPKVTRDSNLDFRINPFRSGCPIDRCQTVTYSLRCQRQSFRRVSWKSADDCMRNANKSKIPFCNAEGSRQVIRKRVWDRITTKS